MVLLLLQQNNARKESKVFPSHYSKNNYNRRKFNNGFYALTGRTNSSGTGLFLCCVCHEQNTTYRYEVIYKDNDNTIPFNNTTLYTNENSLLQITDDSGIHSSSDDHEYYNFPPRHPRHGHLNWKPVLASILSQQPSAKFKTDYSIKTYPDYPVHIPTTTLRKAAAVINTGKQKHHGQCILKLITN